MKSEIGVRYMTEETAQYIFVIITVIVINITIIANTITTTIQASARCK
jgi:hypothetical protein